MTTSFDAPTTAIDDITGDYTLDVSHSRLGFVARHAMVTKVRGQFGAFTGTARIDEATPASSKVDLSIEIASVETGSPDRDGHLKSGDFFDAETYPTMTFTSTDVARDGNELDRHRRPHDQGRHQVRRDPLRADRLGPGPLRQRARRLRGRDHHQPQGLGPHLERRARDRRRPRLREDQARVRHLGDQERLTSRRVPTRHTSRVGASARTTRADAPTRCISGGPMRRLGSCLTRMVKFST